MNAPRKIVTRSPHRRVGYIPCSWLQPEHVAYESLLEADFIRIALFCPSLREIFHQPFRLDLGDDLGTYTPDFFLRCRGLESLVVEVKPSAHVEKHGAKLDAARAHLEAKGYEFIVCTEKEIRTGDRAERASQIQRQARSLIPIHKVEGFVRQLSGFTYPLSVEELANKLGTTVQWVMYLVGRRYLEVPPDLRLDEIYYREQGEGNHGSVSARAWISGSAR